MSSQPEPLKDTFQPRKYSSPFPRSRSDAYKSFENLVALANDQERWKLADVTEAGRNLVWRDVGEPPVLLESLRECAEHAAIGGFRAGSLAFAARSGFNLFILIFHLARTPKRFRLALIRHAILGPDSMHFGAMLATFVGLYKFIVNALPILALRISQSKKSQGALPDGTTLRSEDATSEYPRGLEREVESIRSSYPSSDAENGVTMVPRKPALKLLNLTSVGSSNDASSESSCPRSPPSPMDDNIAGVLQNKARRARFAEKLEQPEPDRPREPHLETASHALRHPGHLSTSTQAAFSLMREKGYVHKRWHATVAGAVAGAVAILMEKKTRRLGISQQLFVRGLQGSFNHWSEHFGIHVPFGSVWVFALCCGQIMYGFLLRPDTTPRSYNAWIQQASIVPQDAITINRQLAQKGTLDIEAQLRLATGKGRPWNGTRSIVTDENRVDMLGQIERAKNGDMGPPMASCAAIHPHENSCIVTGITRIYEVGKWMAPMYGALHFIPMLLFKRKLFFKRPLRMSAKALLGTLRSASFLGVFVAIYQSYICLLHFLYLLPVSPHIAPAFRKFLMSKPVWWLGGILSGLSLFVEDRKRRGELAMYVLPKGLESGWKLFRSEVFGVPTDRKKGWKSDVALCAAGMGMLMLDGAVDRVRTSTHPNIYLDWFAG